MKKMIQLLATVLAGTMLLSACGTNTRQNADGQIELTFSFWEPSTSKEMETTLGEIASSYEAEHPNVKITLKSQPVDGYQEWIKAQFSAGTAPDIEYNQPANMEAQIKAERIVDLTEYLSQPNPYSNSGEAWQDDFVDGKLNAANPVDGKLCGIPVSGLGLAYFYNKTLYDELGLEEPKTWDEMLANFEVIRQHGETPVAMMGQKEDAVNWMAWEIGTGLVSEKFLSDPTFNVNMDSEFTTNEFYRAIDSGDYDLTKPGEVQDLYKLYLDTLREYGTYCNNAMSLDEAGAKALFLSGEAAHIFTGSWDIKSFMENDDIGFEVGAFGFPHFTKDDCEYATDDMTIVDVSAIAITENASQSEEKLAAAVDFVQYLTAPDNYAKYVEGTFSIPVVENVDVNPVFTAFQGGQRSILTTYAIGSVKAEYRNYNANVSMISGEDIPFEQICTETQKALQMLVDEKEYDEPGYRENNYDLGNETPEGEYVPYVYEE